MTIGAWVIDQACAQQARWRRDGLGAIAMSINLSALQLRDPNLSDVLRSAIERNGIDPADIEIELTESTLMDSAEQTLAQLHSLKSLGVLLSIDRDIVQKTHDFLLKYGALKGPVDLAAAFQTKFLDAIPESERKS